MLLSAAILLAIVGIYATFAHDLSRARSRLVGRSETISTTSGTLEFAASGNGEPVLVVHGAEGGFDQALDMARPLLQRGFRLIAPSRFGYLRSTWSRAPVTPEIQADAYAELLDRLRISKVSVAAVSAGAWSALQFAIRNPQRCRGRYVRHDARRHARDQADGVHPGYETTTPRRQDTIAHQLVGQMLRVRLDRTSRH